MFLTQFAQTVGTQTTQHIESFGTPRVIIASTTRPCITIIALFHVTIQTWTELKKQTDDNALGQITTLCGQPDSQGLAPNPHPGIRAKATDNVNTIE